MRSKAMLEDISILAKTLYGEAEVDNEEDAQAIASVILNRTRFRNWPNDISEVCLQPWQFSCWNANDPGRERIAKARGKWFERCKNIAELAVDGYLLDRTKGSTHYYATYVKKPKWAGRKKPVFEVRHKGGNSHLFFNNIDTKPPESPKQALDQVEPLRSQPVMQSAAGTTASVGIASIAEAVSETQSQIEPLVHYAEIAKYLFLFLAFLSACITIYSIFKTRLKGAA